MNQGERWLSPVWRPVLSRLVQAHSPTGHNVLEGERSTLGSEMACRHTAT